MGEPVSILIPAYNERFFAQALDSALSQRYPDFEVVVCDDSRGTAIERCVADMNSPRVRYQRNPMRLGFGGNFIRCFREARADLVKFLNDDDRLRPECLAVLAGIMQANPSVTLATSRRDVIDAQGRATPPIAATAPVAHVSSIVRGRDLGDLALANSVNVIGEPSTVMFRRSAVVLEEGELFRWGSTSYLCLADLSLWVRLLAQGFGYYHAEALSEFRMHDGQEQATGQTRLDAFDEWLDLLRQSRLAGFLATRGAWLQALRALRARLLFGGPLERYEPAVRVRLERVLREVEQELETAAA